MAVSQLEFCLGGRTAATDFTGKQFHFAKLALNGQVALCGNGEAGLGIIQDEPKQGQAVNVAIHGISKAVAGGNISEGDALQANAAGKAITKGAGVELAVALESGVANQLISVLLK